MPNDSTLQKEAAFLCRNARSFCRTLSRGSATGDAELYYVAISIELSLKSFLRLHGLDDDAARRQVRHDLPLAAEMVAGLGLRQDGLSRVLDAIARRYATGGFRRPPEPTWCPAFVREARSIALELNGRVGRACG